MTEPQPPTDYCTACGFESIEYWNAPDSWICPECGYVLQDEDEGDQQMVSVDIGKKESPSDETADTPWQERITIDDKSEANLVEVLEQMEKISEDLDLPEQTTRRAAEIVTSAWETNFMHGRSKEVTVCAAVFAASRESGQAVPPGTIANHIDSGKSAVKSAYRGLKREQELDIDPPQPKDYVEHLCVILGFTDGIPETATSEVAEIEFHGGNPIGTAAAGVYEALQDDMSEVTLQEVATAAGLTKETVWRHADRLRMD